MYLTILTRKNKNFNEYKINIASKNTQIFPLAHFIIRNVCGVRSRFCIVRVMNAAESVRIVSGDEWSANQWSKCMASDFKVFRSRRRWYSNGDTIWIFWCLYHQVSKCTLLM